MSRMPMQRSRSVARRLKSPNPENHSSQSLLGHFKIVQGCCPASASCNWREGSGRDSENGCQLAQKYAESLSRETRPTQNALIRGLSGHWDTNFCTNPVAVSQSSGFAFGGVVEPGVHVQFRSGAMRTGSGDILLVLRVLEASSRLPSASNHWNHG
jgi:hypothetical protein